MAFGDFGGSNSGTATSAASATLQLGTSAGVDYMIGASCGLGSTFSVTSVTDNEASNGNYNEHGSGQLNNNGQKCQVHYLENGGAGQHTLTFTFNATLSGVTARMRCAHWDGGANGFNDTQPHAENGATDSTEPYSSGTINVSTNSVLFGCGFTTGRNLAQNDADGDGWADHSLLVQTHWQSYVSASETGTDCNWDNPGPATDMVGFIIAWDEAAAGGAPTPKGPLGLVFSRPVSGPIGQ